MYTCFFEIIVIDKPSIVVYNINVPVLGTRTVEVSIVYKLSKLYEQVCQLD